MGNGDAHRPRLLVFAYACDPSRGSEEGAGWGLVQALARFADCVVLVGPEGWEPIQAWEAANPGNTIRFVLVSDRLWARPITRTHNRIGYFLAYLGWLPRAGAEARRLIAVQPFDAAFHATYSTYWLPAPATALGIPSVWGPVGGGVVTPFSLWPLLGAGGIVGEIVDLMAVRALAWYPQTRATWHRATTAIVQNEETRRRLPPDVARTAVLMNHAVFGRFAAAGDWTEPRDPYMLWAGLLQARKGPELAMQAIAACSSPVRLVVAGDGPERPRMEAIATELGIADQVDFLGMVDRVTVLSLMRGAVAVLFTGLREEGGLALSEAMLLGVPVIVLAHGGAGVLAAATTDQERVSLVAPGRAADTVKRMAAVIDDHWQSPRPHGEPLLDQQGAQADLEALVRRTIASSR